MTPRVSSATQCADSPQLDCVASSVIYTLAYFSIFRHPLRREELEKYLQFCRNCPGKKLQASLDRLLWLGLIGVHDGLYYLAGQDDLVDLRRERTKAAEPWYPQLPKAARVMALLPFVRGVALTGSLSKGTQDGRGDLDFLLVCRPGRLWTTQFFIGAIRRLFPSVKKLRCCPNYLLAADFLGVQRKSLFIATEIVFARPLVNGAIWDAFFAENSWVEDYYPHWQRPAAPVADLPDSRWKRLAEWVFGGRLGDVFEQNFGKIMHAHVKRKNARAGRPLSEKRRHPSEIVLHRRSRQKDHEVAWKSVLQEFRSRHDVRLACWPWSWDEAPRLEQLTTTPQPAP